MMFLFTFNRTAYGIEMLYTLSILRRSRYSFNRTAYGIEIKFLKVQNVLK